MNRSIIAQTGLADLKFELEQIAKNLSAHLNADLSKAHGINIVAGAYRDDHGDVIGNYNLRFSVAGVIYYAPAVTSNLPGQLPTNGEISTSGETTDPGVNRCAWITDYTSEQIEQAKAINNDVLIGHTRLSQDEVHGGLTVIVQDSHDAQGHVYGTHIIRIHIAGQLYDIPCTTRLGGPLQALRYTEMPTVLFIPSDTHGRFGMNGTTLYMEVSGNAQWPEKARWQVFFQGGEFPVDYEWQASGDNILWEPFWKIVDGVKVATNRTYNGCGFAGEINPFGTLPAYVPMLESIFDIETPGGNKSAIYYMRLRLITVTGTYYTQKIMVSQQDST